jgi:SpoVK/Ycf46/Vps4 family AAA+-type ATPase
MTVLPRFAAEVRLHMLTTFGVTGSASRPQILLIYGAPGTGKTFQLTECLRAYQVEPVVFDSAEVEHGTAGKPVDMLKAKINKVCKQNSHGTPSALILDDVDLLLGRFAGTQYTHNLQHIIQELMRVAVGIADATGAPERVPMFLLANDISNLHLPLLRLGRARFFHWMPMPHEMALIVQHIFQGPASRRKLQRRVTSILSGLERLYLTCRPPWTVLARRLCRKLAKVSSTPHS